MTASDVVAREVVVHGRVQGVFFRAGCQQQAARAGVGGWVTNAPDGTVRARFEGAASAVDVLVAWCRDGPAEAAVDRVEVVDREPTGLSRFTIR